MTSRPDVYRALQRHLDHMPVPFPETTSGVELRLLRYLFDPNEAEIALHMSIIAEPGGVIHKRIGTHTISRQELQTSLKNLSRKGAIFGGATARNGHRIRTYGVAPLAVGMFEMQVNRLTPEYVRDFRQYMDEGFRAALMGSGTSQMRTVPVHASIDANRTVTTYDNIRSYIESSEGPFAVMNCVCRQGAELVGSECTTSSTHETCLMIGENAIAVIMGRNGRRIEKTEFIEIMDRAEREGHVLQPQNTQRPSFICCCCRDCCELLTNARKLPRPADVISTSHRATVDEKSCIGCKKCMDRCPMDAIAITDCVARVDAGRCIGCGLCVTTCPTESMALLPRRHAGKPPKSVGTLYARILAERRGITGVLATGIRRLLGKPF